MAGSGALFAPIPDRELDIGVFVRLTFEDGLD